MDDLETIREQNRWKPDSEKTSESEPKSSLPKTTIVLMTVTAIFFDALQAILTFFGIGLVASPFISIVAGLTFFLWFMMHGISVMTPKRLLGLGGGFFGELIPAIDALPGWTAAVWYTISTTKIAEVTAKIPGGKLISTAMQAQSGKKTP